jgi:hypothetical protein
MIRFINLLLAIVVLPNSFGARASLRSVSKNQLAPGEDAHLQSAL